MRLRAFLRLYPRQWRQRYGEEVGALLEGEALTPAAVVDVVRGAIDAHLHPQLVGPSLAAATGSGGIHLVPHSPGGRVLTLAVLTLVALSGWTLAQPLPYLPLILPIGAHASPEDFARSQASPGQHVRVTVEHDGLAGVLLVDAGGTAQTLVTAYRASTLGWMGGGESKSSGGPPPSAERPLRAGYGWGWTAGPIGTQRAFGFAAVHGVVSDQVTRVVVLFGDGSREEPPIREGAFLWFAGRWDLAPPPYPDRQRSHWEEQWFGRAPTAVIAYSAEGTQLAKQEFRQQQ